MKRFSFANWLMLLCTTTLLYTGENLYASDTHYNNELAEHFWLAYELADCDEEHKYLESYYSLMGNRSHENISGNSRFTSMMMDQCDECPAVEALTLEGVPNFPEFDSISLCTSVDTLTFLIFNKDSCPISNVIVDFDLDLGLAYGGFVQQNANSMSAGSISNINTSDPNNPVFTIDEIAAAEVFIIDIGVGANCDVIFDGDLGAVINVSYSYPSIAGQENCELDLGHLGSIASGIKVPVINTRTVTPQMGVFTNLTDQVCQVIELSQDGIDAHLNEFTFQACNLDPSSVQYDPNAITVNGIAIPVGSQTFDATTNMLEFVVDGSYFGPNTGPSANGDMSFNVSEILEVEICYSVMSCIGDDLVIDYKAFYGCDDKICGDVTKIEGSLSIQPDFMANPIALTSNVSYGAVCGDNTTFDITLSSANTDPLEGLWKDLLLKYNVCLSDGLTLDGIQIGGVAVPTSYMTFDGTAVTLDFSTNTLSTLTFTDEDGDGIYNDLPGGTDLIITTSLAIGCSSSMGSCNGLLDCTINSLEVNGIRNCNIGFQEFADFDTPICFNYASAGSTTNDVPTAGHSFSLTEEMVTVCDTWLPGVEGYEFSYDTDIKNIGGCSNSSGIKLVAQYIANGSRATHIRFEAGSATYQGVTVPGATGTPILDGTDTVGWEIIIPMGDPTATSHDYYFNMEYQGECYVDDYTYINYKVVEDCMDCGTDPCEIVRACGNSISYVEWNGCDCICPMEVYVDTVYRMTTGYSDKALTNKLSPSDIPIEDQKRFLPGDTAYIRTAVEIFDPSVFDVADQKWTFTLTFGEFERPLLADVNNVTFKGWFIEKAATGIITEIGIPDCMKDYPVGMRDNHTNPGLFIPNAGLESGGNITTGTYTQCLTDPNLNPTYDPTTGSVYAPTSNGSLNDRSDDRLLFQANFSLNSGCKPIFGDTNPPGVDGDAHDNGCHQQLLDFLDIQPGDRLLFDYEVPWFHNPNVELGVLNGTTQSDAFMIRPSFSLVQNDPTGACGNIIVDNACWASTPLEGHLPGPVTITPNVCVNDCDIDVNYTFNIENPLPEVDLAAGEVPWYQNEYRPFEATEYLNMKFPNNLVYEGDAAICKADGTTIPVPTSNIDQNGGNIACIDDGSGGVCCTAADPSQLAGLRFVDDDYYKALSLYPLYNQFDVGTRSSDVCDIRELQATDCDPFPHIMVGGPEEACGWNLKYSLTALCPADVLSADFELDYQFAERYIPAIYGTGGNFQQNGSGPNVHSIVYPINPYLGGHPNSVNNYFTTISPHPDDSNESINPLRQTGTSITTPDQFTDKSMDFPPLMAMSEQVLIADAKDMSEMNTIEICAGNAGGATHMNVVTTIDVSSAISLLGVTDLAGGPLAFTLVNSTALSNTYYVVLPDLAPGECTSVVIESELNFCPVNTDIEAIICVKTTSGCLDPEKAALLSAAGGACDDVNVCYEYLSEEADIQVEWSPQPEGPYSLCGTIPLGIRLKNVKPSTLVDLFADFWVPQGLNIVPGSFAVCYEGGPTVTGVSMPIPDPTNDASQDNVFGTNYGYDDFSFQSDIFSNGLPGILAGVDSNMVSIKFEVETVCDMFTSGSKLYTEVGAADPCESTVMSMFVESDPIIIENADPVNFAQFVAFAAPLRVVCSDEATTLNLTYLNVSPTGSSIESMVCLDIDMSNMDYVMGSLTWISPSTWTSTITETMNGNIAHVCFDIPDGIGPGQAFEISADFLFDPAIGCDDLALGIEITSEIMDQTCMELGTECSVFVTNSINPTVDLELAPPLTISKNTLTHKCPNGDGTVDVCYTMEYINETTETYSDNIEMSFFYDIDNDTIFNEALDPQVGVMNTHFVTVAPGDTIEVRDCITVPEDQSCQLWHKQMQASECVCDETVTYAGVIQADVFADLGERIALCPMTEFCIANCGDWNIGIFPAAAGTITPNAAGDSLCIMMNPGFGETDNPRIRFQSQIGSCPLRNINVYLDDLSDFELGPFDDVSICSNDCVQINLGIDPDLFDNANITITPDLYLDDNTSPTPTICDPIASVTYQINVEYITPSGEMCEFNETLELVVEDPMVEDLFEDTFICEVAAMPLEAPAGKDNYTWFQVNPGSSATTAGTGPTFVPTETGTYYLACSTNGELCSSLSNEFTVSDCVDLALTKTVNSITPGPYFNGSTITYDVTVYNQSLTVDVFNVTVKDYFPECLVLADPTWSVTTAPTASANGVAEIVSPIAFIPANGQQTRTITFTISSTCSMSPIVNDAEISGYDDDNDPMTPPAPDEDSTPDNDANTASETGTDNNYDDDNPNMPGTMDDLADSDDFDPESIEFVACESIGGEVFIDMNNNGCEDAEDTEGVAFVDVTIWACDPATGLPTTVVGSTITGSNGAWSFGGIDPVTGMCALDPNVTYTASFDIPNAAGEVAGDPYLDYEFSTGVADATCTAGEDDNVDPDTGIAESCFNPSDTDGGDGDDDNNIDAGITPPCESIGGEVFVDINNNGCQDASETTMVEGAEVSIWSCDPATGLPLMVVGTTMTGADGTWSYGGRDPLTGMCLLDDGTTYTASFDVPNGAGEAFEDYDFSTGTADATCTAGEADDVDSATGIAESCFDPSDDDAGDGDDDNHIDAGISPPCESIGGEVFIDDNNNGCQDASETTMVEGAEVTIWSCDPVTGAPDNVVGVVTTGADGTWTLGGTDPVTGECLLDSDATYTASFDIPNAVGDVAGDPYVGYNFSTGEADATCTDGEADDVDSSTGIAEDCYDPNDDDATDGDDDNDIDAGISPCETMGGEVFVDFNNNGCQDAGETMMVEGAVATIWSCDPITGDPDNVIGTATTDADGQWMFGGADPVTGDCLLDPSETYTVSFDVPTGPGEAFEGFGLTEGTADATCTDGEADDVDSMTGIAEDCYNPDDEDGEDGDDDENIDAGISPPCESIGGEVFVDINNNGCQDASENLMVPGAEVTIWACDPATGLPSTVVGMTTTGADGSWEFGGMDPATGVCNLDPMMTYTASFDVPNGPGEAFEGYGFTEGTADATCTAGEADDVDSATGIGETCYDPSDDDAGDGDDDENIDAGITPPCESIGGEVFVDDNNNGCEDAGETVGVPFVDVTIWECDPVTGLPTVAVGTTMTGSNGAWIFGAMDPVTGECILDPDKTYTVSFDLPNTAGEVAGDPYVGYNFSTGEADATCADGEADDVDSGTGIAEDCYDPSDDDGTDGDDDNSIDAGISPCETLGGEVFVDTNNNGCQDAGETMMVEGAVATIWSCDPVTGDPDNVIGTATTDADGQWMFGGADPATGECLLDPTQTYTVSFDMPTGPGEAFEGYGLTQGVADASCAAGESDDVDSTTGVAEECYNPDDEDGDDGDDDENIDAAITPACEDIGGEVFVDINNNGCQDAGETMMVPGVEVTISACDPATGLPSTVVGTTTTGADGSWMFGGMDPATGICELDPTMTYSVSFDLPNGAGEAFEGYDFTEGTADATCTDGESDDVDSGTGTTETCYDPSDDDGSDGDDDNDIDAGITPACESIGGEVFVDDNNNGCQDAGETTMVEGAVATIWSCDPVTGDPDNVIGMATTGADGAWSFGGMDPATGVCILDPTQTYTVSFDIPNSVGDVAGDPYVGLNFSTGTADASCTDGEADDVDSGTGVAESCYNPSDDDGVDGDDDNDIDAGISPCETIGGEVFVDINNNGCQDAVEMMMVEGAEVTIWTCDPITGNPTTPVGTATTDANGQWSFGGADPVTGECLLDPTQTYTASFDMPTGPGEAFEGYGLTEGQADARCTDGESDDVDPTTGIAEDCFDPTNGDGDDDEHIDAAITPPCESIGGQVFVDINNNGCQDAGEDTMVPGVDVTIWACDPATGLPSTVVGMATTGSDGVWMFGGMNPMTGICELDDDVTYTASFDIPNQLGDLPGDPFLAFEFTDETADATCADGEDDNVDPGTGVAEDCLGPANDDGDGDDDDHIDAGITPPCQSIGGEVFVDENNNGCQDAGETTGVEGVEVTVWSCDPITGAPTTPVGIVTTGADGSWAFGAMDPVTGVCQLDPDATYTVSFDLPNAVGDVAGDPYVGYDFSTEEADGTCADGEDDNVDPSTGIANECYDPNDDDPSDGDDDNDIDAGISPCESMGGTVFIDMNNDGCQGAGESTAVPGVEVTIWSCDPVTGTPVMAVGSTTTGADGAWEFTGADPATGECLLDPNMTYTASFDLPNGAGEAYEGYMMSTGESACADDADADDVDPSTGLSDCYNPDDEDGDDGDSDEDIDLGIFPCQELGGTVFYDSNLNGCQDAGEPVVTQAVGVMLFECGQDPMVDAPIATTTTINGDYEFGMMSPNPGADVCLEEQLSYFVVFDIPNGAGEGLENHVFTEGTETCASPMDADDVDPTTGQSECYGPGDADGTDDEDIDAGIYACENLEGVVFYDLDNNGCQEGTESVVTIPVMVTLYECGQTPGVDPPVAETMTIDGEYEFGLDSDNVGADVCLEPTTSYFVVFDLPNDTQADPLSGFEFTTNEGVCALEGIDDDVDPSNGYSECYDPSDDGANDDGDDHVDVGIYPCQDLGGEIFYDVSNNGCQETGENLVLPSVTVQLFECGQDPLVDAPIATTMTVDGAYEFGEDSPNPEGQACLEPGTEYFVYFDIPNGAGEVLQGYGLSTNENFCVGEGTTDDFDHSTGQSECYDPADDDETDGDDDEHVDIGIFECESLGGTAFYDMNNNGCQDESETAVSEDITVSLFECSAPTPGGGTLLATTTTINGDYEFGAFSPNPGGMVCLEPGKEYYVEFSIPNGPGEELEHWNLSSHEDVCANPADADDVEPNSGQSGCFDPEDAGEDPDGDGDNEDGNSDNDIDVGIYPCQEMGGEIFVDTNNNGCQDPSESLVTDPVGVMLFECGQDPLVDAPVASTTTSGGAYEFGPESPNTGGEVCLDPYLTYFIQFDIPAGTLEDFHPSTGDSVSCAGSPDSTDADPDSLASDCFDPSSDDDDDDIDLGISPCQELGGEIFLDENNSGCQDAGEPLIIEDVTVTLYACTDGQPGNGTPIASTVTNTGMYEFGPNSMNPGANVCLEIGTLYYVGFEFDSSEGAPLQGHNFSSGDETCGMSDTADDVDRATGLSGCYDPDDSVDDGDDDIDVGINPCQELAGTVYYDLDGNGCQDGTETAVTEEVEVTIFECNSGSPTGGTPLATTTTINGEYQFSEVSPNPGAQVCLESDKFYYVQFNIASNSELSDYAFTQEESACANGADADDVDPTTGTSECYNPDDNDTDDGDDDNHVDVGLIPLAKIGDFVWQDCDGDGQQGPGEVGLPAIEVLLYSADGTLVSMTMTDGNGAYLFDNLIPGDYYIEFIAPGEYMFAEANLGNSSGSDSDITNQNGEGTTSIFTLSPGECDLTSADAGLYKCVQIGDLVWFDTNENNVWDSQENGVNGLRIDLYRQNANGGFDLYEYTYSGHKPGTPSDDGYFKFCAPPGTYYLEFAQPPYGMVPALANQGNFEEIDSDVTHVNGQGTTAAFSVSCGQERCDIGAGYYPMGTIGDFVWLDNNQNGVRDPNDAGIANVLVQAYDVQGNMLGYGNTDATGQYSIDYLQAIDVYLKFTPPTGYAATSANMTVEEMDSDIDNSNGPMTTQYYNIVPGEHIPNVDAGLVFGAVPVEWVSFDGQNAGKHNQLDWSVTSQIDVSHYEIERSLNDVSNFTTIGKILSYGTSAEIVKYEYKDFDISKAGTYYYRIKQVDLDGKSDYTNMIAIDIKGARIEKPKTNVYPNPMVDDFTLEVETFEDGLSIDYTIMNVDGKIVHERTFLTESVSVGKHIFSLSAKDLTPGIYTMRVNAGLTIVNKKLIVVSN